MIDAARLKEEFLELAAISSPSKREGTIARRLEAILKGMGAGVEVDGAGEKIEGDTGNLLARFPGNTPGAPPFLLSGHMDTVGPAERIRPVVEGDVIRTDGTSVLGGDDKAGVVAILEAIRVLRERAIPHGDIEVVLTICEEYGLLGAKNFDTGRLRARRGLVLDVDGVCELITRAPAANRMSFTVHGLPAHAGICPEQGMSAIQIAAEAIAAMKLGRLDAETTANLGIIQGGLATNIVPAMATVRGETRSLSLEKLEAQTAHMRACFDDAARRHSVRVGDRSYQARVEAQVDRQYARLDIRDDASIVRLVQAAAAATGRTCRTRGTGGGSDANVFAERGLEVANLACGMREIHTVNEWVDVRDLVLTAGLVVETVRLNAAV
ncbi:MAG TPA: M20/M25/M40 family metallo-hydrolase [Methylomirabilota bacterium]|jgi:tripeptide aminopeptidase|nr:M20/M25/M40 family metallo-hydrolase [Methylomirabilota bacterium]